MGLKTMAAVATFMAGFSVASFSVTAQTLPPACLQAMQAQDTTANVSMTCGSITDPFASDVPPICQLFFEYYMNPPAPKPMLDLMPILMSGNYSGLFDSSFAASTIQYMISNGIMSQSGDTGEMMYVASQIQAAWNTNITNSSQATQWAMMDPWQTQWYALADRLVAKASNYSNGWDNFSRSSAYLRAGSYYFTGQWPFPTSKTSLAAAKKSADAFHQGLLLSVYNATTTFLSAPYKEGSKQQGKLPIIFMTPPQDAANKGKKFPLIVFTTGLDYFKELMWTWYAPGALKRGYAVAFFDGPGQGQALNQPPYFTFTPSWDKVVGAVLDALQAHPVAKVSVDFKKVAQVGYSTGGWLGAASCKGLASRTAACVLSPALLDLSLAFIAPSAQGFYGAMTFIAQQAPDLLPKGMAPLFLDATNKVMIPLIASCPADSPAPYMLNGYFAGAFGQGVVDSDLLYLLYGFAGVRSGNISDLYDNAWQAYKILLNFNSTKTAGNPVPTLVLNGSEDDVMGSQSKAYFASLTNKKSKIHEFNAMSGGALHCQSGAVLAQEAEIYAWLNPIMGVK